MFLSVLFTGLCAVEDGLQLCYFCLMSINLNPHLVATNSSRTFFTHLQIYTEWEWDGIMKQVLTLLCESWTTMKKRMHLGPFFKDSSMDSTDNIIPTI